ncbi:MAG: hypothetical protein COA52_12485 [Hyphomicrobiales bacterium]|nr:MAG: hypothetical protein COA52_12485 [Hyphomicrobiales bacterium]
MRKHLATFVSIFVLLVGTVMAADGDVEYGEYLSSECVSCHLLSGEEHGIPSIIGMDEASFLALMQSYRNKERENPTMQTIAGALDEEQLSALANYFSTLSSE